MDVYNKKIYNSTYSILGSIKSEIKNAEFDKTVQATVIKALDNEEYGISIDGDYYIIKSTSLLGVGSDINVHVPMNDFTRISVAENGSTSAGQNARQQISLPGSSDLNNCIDVNTDYFAQNSVNSLKNRPSGVSSPFKMCCESMSLVQTQIVQRLFCNGELFQRVLYNTSWNSWQKVMIGKTVTVLNQTMTNFSLFAGGENLMPDIGYLNYCDTGGVIHIGGNAKLENINTALSGDIFISAFHIKLINDAIIPFIIRDFNSNRMITGNIWFYKNPGSYGKFIVGDRFLNTSDVTEGDYLYFGGTALPSYN